MVASKRNVRAEVRQWLKDETAGQDDVSLPDLAEEAKSHFGRDREFVDTFFEEGFYDMVYDLAQRFIASTRRDLIPTPTGGITRQALEEQARQNPRWERWFEHVEEGRHVNFMKLTRSDLEKAIDNRQRVIEHETVIRDVMCELKDRLTRDDERVEDRFSLEQVNQIYLNCLP